MKQHRYTIPVSWNSKTGTTSYHAYSRNHHIGNHKKAVLIPATSDPQFNGDENRYNPEELFLSSIASCHMLWYLHLCAVNKITVVNYQDSPEGQMTEKTDGSGAFDWVKLQPQVVILEPDNIQLAQKLHELAHKKCFVANSVSCAIQIHAVIMIS